MSVLSYIQRSSTGRSFSKSNPQNETIPIQSRIGLSSRNLNRMTQPLNKKLEFRKNKSYLENVLHNIPLSLKRSEQENKTISPQIHWFQHPKFVNFVSGKVEIVDEKCCPNLCGEYAKDIIDNAMVNERKFPVLPNYLQLQTKLSKDMRRKIINYLIQTCDSLCLHSSTLFLAISIFERYLSVIPVSESRDFIILCYTSLFISNKFNERIFVKIQKFSESTNISCEDLKKYEIKICYVLDFQLKVPTCYFFAQRFLHVASASDNQFLLTNYFLKLSALNENCLNYAPSAIAAAAVFLAMSMCPDFDQEYFQVSPQAPQLVTGALPGPERQNSHSNWSLTMIAFTNYTTNQVEIVARELAMTHIDCFNEFFFPKQCRIRNSWAPFEIYARNSKNKVSLLMFPNSWGGMSKEKLHFNAREPAQFVPESFVNSFEMFLIEQNNIQNNVLEEKMERYHQSSIRFADQSELIEFNQVLDSEYVC